MLWSVHNGPMVYVDWGAWLCFIAAVLALVAFIVAVAQTANGRYIRNAVLRIVVAVIAVPTGLLLVLACLFTYASTMPDIHGAPLMSPNNAQAARPTNWGYVFAGGSAVDLFWWHGLRRQRVFQAHDGYHEQLHVSWHGSRDLLVEYPQDVHLDWCKSTERVRVQCVAVVNSRASRDRAFWSATSLMQNLENGKLSLYCAIAEPHVGWAKGTLECSGILIARYHARYPTFSR